MKTPTLPEKPHKIAIRLIETAATIGSLIGGAAATETSASAAPSLQRQTQDTELAIEHSPQAVRLVDEYVNLPAGTVIFKYPNVKGGKLTVVGPDEQVVVRGIVAAANPDSGSNAKMEAITIASDSGAGANVPTGVAWVKYGGLKSIQHGFDPDHTILHRDEAYAPHISMNNQHIVATYDQAHEHTIQSQDQINGDQILVGEVSYMSNAK